MSKKRIRSGGLVWFGLAKQLNVSVGGPITRWRGRCSGAIRLAVLIVFVVNILVSIIEGMFFFSFSRPSYHFPTPFSFPL